MDATSFEQNSNSQSDQLPLLLMERRDDRIDNEHVIDITRNHDAASTSSQDDQHPEMDLTQREDRSSSSTVGPTHENSSSSLSRLNSRDSALARRGDGYERRSRSPLDSGLWMSIELVVTVGQIIASVTVLLMSRNENPQAPLFAWVVGYASGCVLTLPVLYWRFRNRSQSFLHDPSHSHQFQNNSPDSTSYTAISSTQPSEEEIFQSTESATRSGQTPSPSSGARLNRIMDHFKMALDCFFAVWFVVGNVWIFGGHSNPADAPKLYKLCIVFLTFSCIGYAMPFILCATICCCLPCIISILGFREDFSQTRGATVEAINVLPTYKFNLQKTENVNAPENDGGVLAAGTEKERTISGEDAMCCICLNKYADNDELRELPCVHVFHVECVDKWLKINASCPLCKCELAESSSAPPPADSGQD